MSPRFRCMVHIGLGVYLLGILASCSSKSDPARDSDHKFGIAKSKTAPSNGRSHVPAKSIVSPKGEANEKKDGWVVFRPKDNSFLIEFPRQPSIESAKTRRGQPMNVFKVRVGNTEYAADYVVSSKMKTVDPSLFPSMLMSSAKSQPRKSITPLKVNGHAAIEFETETFTQRRFHRVCFVGDRIYEWMVTAPIAEFDVKSAKRFLNSFHLTQAAPPPSELPSFDKRKFVAPEKPITATKSSKTAIKFREKLSPMGDPQLAHVVWSPTGELIATAGYGKTVYLWNVKQRKVVRTCKISGSPLSTVNRVAFRPDGQILACAWKGLSLWDPNTGKLLRYLPDNLYVEHPVFSPDGQRIAVSVAGGPRYGVVMWDLKSGKKREATTKTSGVLAFSPDGKTLATSRLDGNLLLLNGSDLEVKRTIQTHDGSIRTLAFSPDGRRILTIGDDSKELRIWDAETGARVSSQATNDFLAYLAQYSPGGTMLLIAGAKLSLLDAKDGKFLSTLDRPNSPTVGDIAFSPDGKSIAVVLVSRPGLYLYDIQRK